MSTKQYVEIHEGPDEFGRCHYALDWMADYHPGHPDGEDRRAKRWQHFYGRPPVGATRREEG